MPLQSDGTFVKVLINGCIACGKIVPVDCFYCSLECVEWDYTYNLPIRNISREEWLEDADNA